MKLFVPIVKLQHIDNKKTVNEFLQMMITMLVTTIPKRYLIQNVKVTNHHHLFAMDSLELYQFCLQGFYNMIVNKQKLVMRSL